MDYFLDFWLFLKKDDRPVLTVAIYCLWFFLFLFKPFFLAYDYASDNVKEFLREKPQFPPKLRLIKGGKTTNSQPRLRFSKRS